MSGGLKLVQTRRLAETPAGTRIFIHLRKPDIPVNEELTIFVVEAYNQVAAGLIKLLEKDLTNSQRMETLP